MYGNPSPPMEKIPLTGEKKNVDNIFTRKSKKMIEDQSQDIEFVEDWVVTNKQERELKKKALGLKKIINQHEDKVHSTQLKAQGFIKRTQMTEQIYVRNMLGDVEEVDLEDEKETATWLRMFLINHDSLFSTLLTFIETLLSILSSYFYTYQATFRNHLDKYGDAAPIMEQIYFEMELYNEIAFAFFMARTFITTY